MDEAAAQLRNAINLALSLDQSNSNDNNTNEQRQNNNNNNQSFLSKLASCAGGIDVLRPYFDIDTADIAVRMKGSLQYVLVMDGFRNEVLYSDNAFRLAYRDTTTGGGGYNQWRCSRLI